MFHEPGFDPDNLSLKESGLSFATADRSHEPINSAVARVLSLLRQRLPLDVVCMCEFGTAERVFRCVESNGNSQSPSEGDNELLEDTWCPRVVDGRFREYITDVRKFGRKADMPAGAFAVNG